MFRIRSTGQVKTQGEIRKMYPNTSLPRVWGANICESLGIDPVLASPLPSNDNPLKTVRQNGVKQDAKGNWVENYEIVDIFQEYTDIDGNTVTKASQEEAFLAKRLADQWTEVRKTRDQKLKDTDWLAIKAAETGVAMADAWSTYRQALRDITNQEDPFNITWPTLPS